MTDAELTLPRGVDEVEGVLLLTEGTLSLKGESNKTIVSKCNLAARSGSATNYLKESQHQQEQQ